MVSMMIGRSECKKVYPQRSFKEQRIVFEAKDVESRNSPTKKLSI